MSTAGRHIKGSLLLVDDTPANLHLLIEALSGEEYEVRPAINGTLALESARAHCPDLVLLDINMPGMDGYEVCRQLKADPVTREVPVIFISSAEETIDKLRAFEAGGVDFINKPFDAEEVLARIRSQLELQRTRRELSEHKQNLERLVAERTAEIEKKNRELCEEIDQRREIEQALHESEQRYLALVEAGFDGIFIHQDSKIISINQQILEMTGFSADELLGAGAFSMVAPADQEKVRAYSQENRGGSLEFDLLKKDGSTLQAETFGVACSFHGKPARIAAVRDISARKKAIADLRQSEQRYAGLYHQFESLLDAISDPLALLTPGMKPLWTNKAYDQACKELGCGQGSELTLFHLDTSGEESAALKCLKSGDVAEMVMLTPDQRRWGVKAFPLTGVAEQINQVIVVAIDITEKVRLREEADRTARLAFLGELAAGIAHEINNPNAVILLNMPIIRDAFIDAERILDTHHREDGPFSLAGIDYCELRENLPTLTSRVLESAERIKRIVEDLKTYVRDDGERDFVELDLNLVVEAAVRLLDNSIRKATNNFRLELAESLPPVVGDFQKLEQVVINLVQNACQALTEETQEVCVATGTNMDTGQVWLRVRDQGCGIEPEKLSQLCDPFFTTKRSCGGTGLGLSVSERILREHQAKLTIEATVGKGAEFLILFKNQCLEQGT